jgi:hypothetical protein
MKPNFDAMSVPELRAYVLSHREDDEAIQALFFHPSLIDRYQEMPPMFTVDGQPIEENIRLADETIRRISEHDRNKHQ